MRSFHCLLSHLTKMGHERALGSPWGEVMWMISSPSRGNASDLAF